MDSLKHVEVGWKWLEEVLNQIIDHLNFQKPVASATVAVQETPNGSVLSTPSQRQGEQPQQQQGAAGQIPGYFWITLYDIWEQVVTVVDPVTCAQSTITVFIRSGQPGGPALGTQAVKFQAYIDLANFTVPGTQPGQPGGPPA